MSASEGAHQEYVHGGEGMPNAPYAASAMAGPVVKHACPNLPASLRLDGLAGKPATTKAWAVQSSVWKSHRDSRKLASTTVSKSTIASLHHVKIDLRIGRTGTIKSA